MVLEARFADAQMLKTRRDERHRATPGEELPTSQKSWAASDDRGTDCPGRDTEPNPAILSEAPDDPGMSAFVLRVRVKRFVSWLSGFD